MSTEQPDKNGTNRYLNYLSGLLGRNKNLLIVSLSIYFGSLVIGLIIGYFYTAPIKNFLNVLVKTDRQFLGKNGLSTVPIFLHNLQSIFITFAGGIIGIITGLTLFFNGFIYGSFLGYFASNNHTIGGQVSSVGLLTPAKFIIYTLPHGIFEISGFIIAGAAGFRLTMTVVKLLGRDANLRDHYPDLKDALALFAIAVVLTFIAAIIEANFSLSIGSYILKL
jgi:stage II sporulation protein M